MKGKKRGEREGEGGGKSAWEACLINMCPTWSCNDTSCMS
jgi:hypothetical protein